MSLAINPNHEVNRLRLIPADSGAAKHNQTSNCKNCPDTHPPTAPDSSNDVVQLEIGLDKLEALFDTGALCAADVHCLNCAAKDCIWNLCLSVCARRMKCNNASSKQYKCCGQHNVILHKDSSVQIGLKREHLVLV